MSRLRTPATAAGASQLRLPLEAGFKEHMGGEDQGGEGQRGGDNSLSLGEVVWGEGGR